MADKRTGHQGAPNPPGYVCRKRRGKKAVTLFLEPADLAAARQVTARERSTLEDEIIWFLKNDLLKRPTHG